MGVLLLVEVYELLLLSGGMDQSESAIWCTLRSFRDQSKYGLWSIQYEVLYVVEVIERGAVVAIAWGTLKMGTREGVLFESTD